MALNSLFCVKQLLTHSSSSPSSYTGDIYGAIIYGAKPYAKVHLGPLSESQSAPGGRHLVGQAANLTFESACRLL